MENPSSSTVRLVFGSVNLATYVGSMVCVFLSDHWSIIDQIGAGTILTLCAIGYLLLQKNSVSGTKS